MENLLEMDNKTKCLLGVEVHKISAKYIYELRQAHNRHEDVFGFLPQYTINTNKGANKQPIVAEYFHQFIGGFADEEAEYLYFNLNTIDRHLDEEISQAGSDEIFNNIDFEKILSVFTPQSEDDLRKFVFPKINYLVVELEYVGGYCEGIYELDEVLINIVGYLDPHTLELKKYK